MNDSLSCGEGQHIRATTWVDGRFTNGTRPLTLRTVVFGDLHVSDTASGDSQYVYYYRH